MTTTPLQLARRPRHLLAMAYALVAYAVAGITVPVLLLFTGGMVLPRHAGRGPSTPALVALVVDMSLLVLFALQHSVMARTGVKAWCHRRIPEALYRSTYVLATCGVVWVVVLGWRPIRGTVWHLDGIPGALADIGFWFGFVVVYAATLVLNHFRLLGIEQACRRYVTGNAATPELTLRTRGIYRLVRHPLMTGLLLCLWSARTMSAGRLLFAAGMSAYIAVGTMLEERDLVATFGGRYRQYAAAVPAFVPGRVRRRAPSSRAAG